jgi:hypothetical protein
MLSERAISGGQVMPNLYVNSDENSEWINFEIVKHGLQKDIKKTIYSTDIEKVLDI